MLSSEISNALQIPLYRHSKQIQSLNIAVIELIVQLQSEQLIPEHCELYLFLVLQDIVNPLNLLFGHFIYKFGLHQCLI